MSGVRKILSMVLIALWGSGAWAQVASGNSDPAAGSTSPRRIAVLSLIGDSLGIVEYRGQTESRVATRTEEVPLPDPVMDKAALLAAGDSLAKRPGPVTVSYVLPTASLYSAGRDLLDGNRFVATPELDAALKARQASHLVLITKHRDDARLRLERHSTGSGKLEGIGYYVDRSFRVSRADNRATGIGFLAPYVYIRVSLVDLSTSSVVGDQAATHSTTYSAARAENSAHPWDVLTPGQKIDRLRSMIREAVLEAVPKLP